MLSLQRPLPRVSILPQCALHVQTARFGTLWNMPHNKRHRVPFSDFNVGKKFVGPSPPAVNPPLTKTRLEKLSSLISGTQELYKGRPIRDLTYRRMKFSGRNNQGRVTVRHRGQGVQQRVRILDFKRGRKNVFGTVLRIEHDPTRSAHIALLQYDDGVLSYIIAPHAVRPGDRLIASASAQVTPGNCLPLRQIPIGSLVHNLEIRPGAGGQVIRAAGCFATLISKDDTHATIKLKSTEIRKFSLTCWATLGRVSNLGHDERILGKAGASRWRGIRPSVRGIAMNPDKHPHGGGTGAKHHKRCPVSMWGVLRTGYKTRSKKPLGDTVRRRLPGKMQKKFGIKA